MGLCVIEGAGGSAGIETAKEKWTELNIRYVEKSFSLNQYVTVSCSMADVLPSGKSLLFAVISSTAGSTRGGTATIVSVTGTNVSVTTGNAYNELVKFTLRGFYLDSGNTPFEIKSVRHYFDIGNPVDGRVDRDAIECSMDTVLPTDAVIIGCGFVQLGNRTGGVAVNSITNRTPILSAGYSYGERVYFTLIAYYI